MKISGSKSFSPQKVTVQLPSPAACEGMPLQRISPRSGQALAEFVVGLIALLALISVLCVGTTLITSHTQSMSTARMNAAADCSMDTPPSSDPKYIKDWKPWTNPFEANNPNKRYSKYTKYDTPDLSHSGDFNGTIVAKTVVSNSDWDIIGEVGGNNFSIMRGSMDPSPVIGLVKGYDTKNIPIDQVPFISHFFGISSIDVECTVWLSQINNLY